MRVQQPGQCVIHGIGVTTFGQALGAQLVESCFCQPILCRRQRQFAACGQIVHSKDQPPGNFGAAAVGALAVVDIAQRPEQDAFVGTVEFNFTFQFFLQCQLYIGKRLSKDDICQNQFTAYVVLAVKRKRQSYIKKKQREHEKETRTKKEAEQSEFRTAGYDMWSRMEPQNEKLMAAMQQLSLKERFVVTEYVLKGKPFKEIAQETGLKEKGVASAYYRSIKKLRAEMGDVK